MISEQKMQASENLVDRPRTEVVGAPQNKGFTSMASAGHHYTPA